jgi:hypothetical protein
MRFSVVIPAFNAATCLGRALDSVQAQTYRPFEVIVVDDGSSDETAAVARSHPLGPRLISIRNSGVSTARNIGMVAASGEYVALLDADDEYAPDHLAGLAAAAAQHRDAVLLWTGISRRFAKGAAEEAGTLPDSNRISLQHAEDGLGGLVIKPSAYDQMMCGNFVSPSSAAFKQVVDGKTRLFRPELKLGEDRVFFLELMGLGKAVFFGAESAIIHRDGANASVTTDRSKQPILTERRIATLHCVRDLPEVRASARRTALVAKLLAQAYRDQVYYASFLGLRKTWAAMRNGWAARSFGPALGGVFLAKNVARAVSHSSLLRKSGPLLVVALLLEEGMA